MWRKWSNTPVSSQLSCSVPTEDIVPQVLCYVSWLVCEEWLSALNVCFSVVCTNTNALNVCYSVVCNNTNALSVCFSVLRTNTNALNVCYSVVCNNTNALNVCYSVVCNNTNALNVCFSVLRTNTNALNVCFSVVCTNTNAFVLSDAVNRQVSEWYGKSSSRKFQSGVEVYSDTGSHVGVGICRRPAHSRTWFYKTAAECRWDAGRW